MRRGGVVILLIGVIIALAAAGLLFFFLQTSPTNVGGPALPPTEDPGVDIVVAKVDIPANTLISDPGTLLESRTISTEEFREEYFTRVTDVQGKLSTNPINAGAPIRQPDVTDPGLSQQIPTAEPDRPRPKAYSFRANSLTGVADQIKPGDFVDVVATFSIPRRTSYPTGQSLEEQAGQVVTVTEREVTETEFAATKTIVQQAQVLRIVRPAVTAEGTPVPAPESEGVPETDASGQPIDQAEGATGAAVTQGSWLLVLAINAQEAELIEFALNTQANVSLVLRGAGDTDFEPTIGASFDLLVSELGVPLPEPLPPRVYGDEVFEGDPTRTPAPTRVP